MSGDIVAFIEARYDEIVAEAERDGHNWDIQFPPIWSDSAYVPMSIDATWLLADIASKRAILAAAFSL